MISTWEEGWQKQALISQIRHACAAQRQQATTAAGKPRADLPLLSRSAVAHLLDSGRDHAVAASATSSTPWQALVVECPYPACKLPLHALDTSLRIRDLVLETRHVGKALIVRRFGAVVTSAVGGTYGVEDEAGSAEFLLVDAYSFAGDEVIPPDAVVAIKEPYCKVDGCGKPRIKLSHATDLVVLDLDDERVPLPWRVEGLVVSDTVQQPLASRKYHSCAAPPSEGWSDAAVEVRATAKAGRGLFAKTGFSFGDQILSETAIFTIFPDDESTFRALKYDLGRNMMTEDHLGAPYKELARRVSCNPSLAAKVFDLHSGNVNAPCLAETLVDGKPVVDTFHIHEVWAKNAIACPATATSEDGSEKKKKKKKKKKAFPNRVSPGDVASASASGLWYRTAYCNHSCIPNAEKSVKHGVLSLRATRRIEKDEEITISYGEHTDRLEKEKALHRIWGFRCECRLCENESRTSYEALTTRQEIRSRIVAPLPEPVTNAAVAEAKSLLNDLQATYPDADANNEQHLPSFALAEAYWRLYAIHTKLVNFDEAEQALLHMMKALCIMELNENDAEVVPLGGGMLDEATVVNVLLLADLQRKARQEVMAKRLEGFAKKVYEVLNGDLEGFETIVLLE